MTRSTVAAGGKGLNVARAARRLGADVVTLGPLGGTAGQQFGALAESDGLTTQWTRTDVETRTCVVVVPEHGNSTVFNEPGPHLTAQYWERFISDVADIAGRVRLVTISGSFPSGADVANVRDLLAAAADGDAQVWLDTSEPWLHGAVPGTAAIKVNHHEAAELLQQDVGSLVGEELVDWSVVASREIRQLGVNRVIITLGQLGAAMTDAIGTCVARTPSIDAVNVVGSGDSFLGGLAVALHDQRSATDALVMGVASGAAGAESMDSSVLTSTRVSQLMSRVDLIRL